MRCDMKGRTIAGRFGATVGLKICLVVLLVAGSLGVTQSPAAAASWATHAQGSCLPGYPRGDTWLNWEGYSSSAEGVTHGTMWYIPLSSWTVRTFGETRRIGSTQNANVYLEASFYPAMYTITGTHISNFFSGPRFTEAPSWMCN